MKMIRSVVCALSITISGVNYSHASGIPTVDIAAVMQNLMEYIGQINEYAEQANRYMEQIRNAEQQLESVSELSNLASLADSLQSLQDQYDRMRNNIQDIQGILDDPSAALTGDLLALLHSMQYYDDCADMGAGVQKDVCDRGFKTKVADVAQDNATISKLQQDIRAMEKLLQELQSSSTLKKSTDTAGSINAKAAIAAMENQQYEANKHLLESQREADEAKKQQRLEKIRRTPASF